VRVNHSDREEGHEARNPGSPFADEGDQEGRAIGERGDMQPAMPATPTTRSATEATFLFSSHDGIGSSSMTQHAS
jgi:hypothetical protein